MKPVLREAALIAFFAVVSGFALRPLPFHLADRIPAGSDPPHHLYILDWLLDHGLSAARFEGRMFHPARNAVLRSDLSIGTVVLMTPLAPFVEEPLVRFNLAVWMALGFSGWAFCLLARSWTGSILAGLLAGLTAVMGSHQSLHYVHLNLLSVGWLPIFLLALDRTLTKPTPAFVALSGISFALVSSSSGYYGVAAVVIGLVMFARDASWGAFRRCARAAVLAALLLAPYLMAYTNLHENEGLTRTSRELAKWSFSLEDLGSRTYVHRRWNPATGEPLFPGFVVLGLAAFAGLGGGRRERTLGLAALALFWLGLGEPGLLYRVVGSLPPFSSMRHPETMTAVAVMLLSVLAAFGLAQLRDARGSRAAVALLLAAAAETIAPPADLHDVAPGVPSVYEAALSLPPGPILDVPPYDAPPLIWAARRGFETLNGGGAFIPAITTRLETTTQNHWLTNSDQPIDDSKAAGILLNETGVRYLIVSASRRGGVASLLDRLRSSRCFRELGVYAGDRLYEAVRDPNCRAWTGVRS